MFYTLRHMHTLLCLHGWGGSKESFTELRDALKGTDMKILTPDLPGFGNEPEPDRPWTTDDYADWVEEYVHKEAKGDSVLLLGHSHGGRIAIKLAVRKSFPIEHLYLCAPAGIRHRRPVKRAAGWVLAKSGKLLLAIPGLTSLQPLAKKFLYRFVRAHDYEQASPLMRETMRRVTAEDLRPILPFIDVPTDLFWGTADTMTPLADGKLMHRKIRGSSLHIFQDLRHRIHRDKAGEIAAVIRQQTA